MKTLKKEAAEKMGLAPQGRAYRISDWSFVRDIQATFNGISADRTPRLVQVSSKYYQIYSK